MAQIPTDGHQSGNRDGDRAILKAGALIGVLSVTAKLSAFVREAVIASIYGRGPEVDAFFLALAIPVFVLNLVAGAYQIALVPAWLKARREGQSNADTLFGASFLRLLVVLAIGVIPMAAAAPLYLPCLAPALSPETLALTADMLWIMTLFVLVGGASIAWGGLLNAERRFALPAIAPALTPIVMAVLLILARDQLGVGALAWGAVVGTALEALIVGWALKRRGRPLRPRAVMADLSGLKSRWVPMLLANLLLGGAGLIDQMMAASLGPGSASAIGYGAKLVLAGLHVATLALGVAVLPAYSEAALGNLAALRKRLRTHVVVVVLISIPAVAIAAFLAEPIIRLLYQRGAFTAEDTALVSAVLIAYASQLPAYAATVILVRAAAALDLGRAIAWAAGVNVVATIGLNLALMTTFGVVGIAAATAPAFMLTAAALYYAIYRNLRSAGH